MEDHQKATFRGSKADDMVMKMYMGGIKPATILCGPDTCHRTCYEETVRNGKAMTELCAKICFASKIPRSRVLQSLTDNLHTHFHVLL